MQLQAIEKVVLNNIGLRYDELSISTDAKEVLDFAMLHTCVNLAREEIKLNTNIPATSQFGAVIPTVAGTNVYSLANDFDIPMAIYYTENALIAATKLTQIYIPSLPESINISSQGTPDSYIIVGTSGNLLQIYLVPTPSVAGFILPLYKPVFAALSLAVDEDILMKKYAKTVIDFASAFAFRILKKDDANFDKFYGLGLAECSKIDFREVKADSNYKELPPKSIINARISRLSR